MCPMDSTHTCQHSYPLSPLSPCFPTSFFKNLPLLFMPASSFHHYYSTFLVPVSSFPLGFLGGGGEAMDDEQVRVNSDEASPPRKSTRKISDFTRDAQGYFVKQLAGTDKGNTNCNSIMISSNYEYDCSGNMPMFLDFQYCYSLLEAMPMPGPVWSTTEPCVLAEPLESVSVLPAEAPPTNEGSVELEWGENQPSSYSWWIGFLESLDGNNMRGSEKVKSLPFVENIVMEDSKGFGYDSSNESCCLDDWLMIPTMEMDLEDMVVP